MANVVYDSFKKQLLNAGINFGTSTLKVMLVTSSYTPVGTTHDFRDDVTNEVEGSGYTAGGAALAGGTVIAGGTAKFDATDLTWGTSTITARGAVLYQNLGTVAGSDPLVGYFDFTEDKVSSSGDFTIQWDANGLVNIG